MGGFRNIFSSISGFMLKFCRREEKQQEIYEALGKCWNSTHISYRDTKKESGGLEGQQK
jgi:hypothetical protein